MRILVLVFLIPAINAYTTNKEGSYGSKVINSQECSYECKAIRQRINRLLKKYPIIDGHNDLPFSIRTLLNNSIDKLNLEQNLTEVQPFKDDPMNHSDLPRLQAGRIGGQFWAAFASCTSQFKDATQVFLEQVDIIKQMIRRYPNNFMWAESAKDVKRAIKKRKIASLIGMESGHAISSSLAILRTFYELGVRYMTLTHSCNTPWADASNSELPDDDAAAQPVNSHGLSDFGTNVVHEMNRLGMMVDISHVSADTMRDALKASFAPVIFSHSSARGVTDHHRNAPDDVLKMLKKNGGVIMVTFLNCYVVDCSQDENKRATISDVVNHINHIRKVAGVDHIGIGGDYNGAHVFPIGLEDTSKYPALFEALAADKEVKWSDKDLAKLANLNILRVMRKVEVVRDRYRKWGEKADNTLIKEEDLGNNSVCSTRGVEL